MTTNSPAAQPQEGELLPCPMKHRVIAGLKAYKTGRDPHVICLDCGLSLASPSWATAYERWQSRADLPRATADEFPLCPKCQQGYVCEHCGDLLRTAPRATGEATVEAWQSIETAPRDGTAILIANDRLVHEVRWMISVDKGAPEGAWFVGGYQGWRLTWKPTGWQLLPAPPLTISPTGENNA